MRGKYGRFIYIVAVLFFIIATIITIVAIVNSNNLNTVKQEKEKLQKQVVTEATKSAAEKKIIKGKKNSINKLENDIQEKTENNSLLSALKEIIQSFVNALSYDNLKDKGILNIQTQLKENTTSECYDKLIKSFDLDADSSEYQKITIRKYWIDNSDTKNPEVCCLSDYENDDFIDVRYLDFIFKYDEDKGKYLISDFLYAI